MIIILTIVDYQAGGIASVKRALDYLGIPVVLSSDPHQVERADCIILPGIGHAATAMTKLENSGMDQAIHAAYTSGVPILAICLGAQISLTWSEEGDTPCLDMISGETLKMHPSTGVKVPHVGWNNLRMHREHPVFDGLWEESFYFVHTCYMNVDDPDALIAGCYHGFDFPAVIGSNNLIGIQFHPEKSGAAGLALLQNFNNWGGW